MEPPETADAAELLLKKSAQLLGEGDAHKKFVEELSALVPLARREGDEARSAANKIVELAGRHDSTRRWMKHYADHGSPPGALRAFEDLPGKPVPPSAERYVCPQADKECKDWYRHSVGAPIPQCKKHKVQLVPAKN